MRLCSDSTTRSKKVCLEVLVRDLQDRGYEDIPDVRNRFLRQGFQQKLILLGLRENSVQPKLIFHLQKLKRSIFYPEPEKGDDWGAPIAKGATGNGAVGFEEVPLIIGC